MSSSLEEIERQLPQLSFEERVTLIERLARTLRRSHNPLPLGWSGALALMAEDPDIQRETREIDEEFAAALRDGLDSP
jgi:hypothetical protein